MSNIFLAGFVLLTLAFFAPLFQWLPETVLAAIVINAMRGSANPRKLERLRQIDKVDFILAFITFFLVLALDLLPAMVVGIVLSIVYMIYRVSFPAAPCWVGSKATAILKRWPGNMASAAARRIRKRKRCPVLSFTASPSRSSSPMPRLSSRLEKNWLIKAGAKGELPQVVVIDFEEISYVDTTGAAAITSFLEYAQRYGVDLSLARVHSGAHKLLQLAGVMDEIGEQRI